MVAGRAERLARRLRRVPPRGRAWATGSATGGTGGVPTTKQRRIKCAFTIRKRTPLAGLESLRQAGQAGLVGWCLKSRLEFAGQNSSRWGQCSHDRATVRYPHGRDGPHQRRSSIPPRRSALMCHPPSCRAQHRFRTASGIKCTPSGDEAFNWYSPCISHLAG